MDAWSLPPALMAAQIIEFAPGLDIEALTDVVLKSAEVKAGLLVVERQFGTLEFHSRATSQVQAAADAFLQALRARREDAAPPTILASKIVTHVDHQHAFLMNRNRMGSLIRGGDSLYLLECKSASYAMLPCNEAEKEANIKVIDYRMM
jgi:hypothetical protein